MDTTLNIRADILEQIARAAQSNRISCSEMIVLLMEKVMHDMSDPRLIGRRVKYQSRCKPEEWHIFHVQLSEDMYEYCQDLRRLLKMSVSFILACAVKKYFNKELLTFNTDNYRFDSYIILKEVLDTAIVWKFIWGIPPNLKSFILNKH